MSDYSSMNKAQLRAVFAEKALSYEGLNVEGMRDTLAKMAAEQPVSEQVEQPATEQTPDPAEPVQTDPVVQELPAPTVPIAPPVVVARAEQNGVKQPSIGTICRQIWDHCDTVYEAGDMPKAKAVRAWGAGRLDDTTMTIQFYRWRKFRGISGRQA